MTSVQAHIQTRMFPQNFRKVGLPSVQIAQKLRKHDIRKNKVNKPKINGRFYIEHEDGEWLLIDSIDGTLVGFETKREALENRYFARQYVKIHGDIDFCSFPFYGLRIFALYHSMDSSSIQNPGS